jgi:hypothetical protein
MSPPAKKKPTTKKKPKATKKLSKELISQVMSAMGSAGASERARKLREQILPDGRNMLSVQNQAAQAARKCMQVPKCPCGAMTVERARKRNHRCQPRPEEENQTDAAAE